MTLKCIEESPVKQTANSCNLTLTIWFHGLLIGIVVKPWNSLSNEVVTAPNVKAFEARLDNFWKDQPIKFNYKEELRL